MPGPDKSFNQLVGLFLKHRGKEADSSEMSAIEKNAIELGISDRAMMEVAGHEVAKVAEAYAGNALVLCGKGNNGGDALVAARYLSTSRKVYVHMVFGAENLSSLAAINYKIASITPNIEIIDDYVETPLLIDGIFGTGFSGSLPKEAREACRRANRSKAKVFAIDVPSGLDASTGAADKDTIRADTTITFHKAKKGFAGNERYTGKVKVAEIGIPITAELYAGVGDIALATRKREIWYSKRESGRVLILGGSADYHGAPIAAANSAANMLASLRVGAGYAVLITTKEVARYARKLTANIVVKEVEDWNDGAIAAINGEIARAEAIAIGMGMGRSEGAKKVTTSVITSASRAGKRVVVDADAIHNLGAAKLDKNIILTPHYGEFKALTGIEIRESTPIVEKVRHAFEFAEKRNTNLLLKGSQTVITNGLTFKINRAESAALATMGTGDVLSGMIAAYATHAGLFRSAVAAANLHAKIGDTLHIERSDHIIATDIIDYIPKLLNRFLL